MKAKEKEADLMAQSQQRAADRAWEKIREKQLVAFKAEEDEKPEKKVGRENDGK